MIVADDDGSSERNTLIVIGASAGSIQALRTLVRTLPEDFPASIIITVHIPGQNTGPFAQILQKQTRIPVEGIHSASPLLPGRIYILPAYRRVCMVRGWVDLQPGEESYQRPCVNSLFTAAAEAYREQVIAVVLTGAGNDGAAGALDVKYAGGMVIIQHPSTAQYPSMPLAVPSGLVDLCVETEQLGTVFQRLLSDPPQLTETHIQELDTLLARQTLSVEHIRSPLLLRRSVQRRMLVTACKTLHEYIHYTEFSGTEVYALLKLLYPNPFLLNQGIDLFTHLQLHILPLLITQAQERQRSLSIWVAGSGTGEVSYMLAMLLIDLLGVDRSVWKVKLVATSRDVTFARQGVYTERFVNMFPASYRERFFEPTLYGYGVVTAVRQLVTLRQQELGQELPLGQANLIICDRELCALPAAQREQAFHHFATVLAPTNGYLLLGWEGVNTLASNNYTPIHGLHHTYQFVRGRERDATGND